MPPKKSGFGRGSKKGRQQKRSGAAEREDAAETVKPLKAQVERLAAELRQVKAELAETQTGIGSVLSGFTGRHRRRSSIAVAEGGDAARTAGEALDDRADQPKRRMLTIETIEQRTTRLTAELEECSNQPGRSRTFFENRTFIHQCIKLEIEVLAHCEERDERPKLKGIAVAVAGVMGYDTAFAQELMANWRSGDTRTILVHETSARGKGSPGFANGDFIDTARRLSPVHLKEIEDFRRNSHAEGGVVSVRTIVQHLQEKFAGTGEE